MNVEHYKICSNVMRVSAPPKNSKFLFSSKGKIANAEKSAISKYMNSFVLFYSLVILVLLFTSESPLLLYMKNKQKEEKKSILANEHYNYLFLEIFYSTSIKIIKCFCVPWKWV